MNKDNPLTVAEANAYLKELRALLGPRLAEQRVYDLAKEHFSLQTRHKLNSEAVRSGLSLYTSYVIELHRCGALPVARGLL